MIEKWEDRKIFNFPHVCLVEWKSGGMEKVSLHKFAHIPLLKNDAQLKQKKWQATQKKKKSDDPNYIKY